MPGLYMQQQALTRTSKMVITQTGKELKETNTFKEGLESELLTGINT